MATLISNKKSTYGSPYGYHTITATETSRTSSKVTIKFTAKCKLAESSSWLGSGSVLKAGVYIGGSWRTWTLKSSSATWSGTASHSASASFSISASASTTSLTGIKVRVLRTDSYGNACELTARTATNSSISIASSATYTITYKANGGTGAPSSGTKTYNVTYKISSTVPTRASETDDNGVVTTYKFSGWKGSDGKTYQPGSSYTTNKALTLTAIWSDSDKYIVSYNPGDLSTLQLADQTKTEGVALTLYTTIPTVNGFTFNYWEGSDGKTYQPGSSYTTNANLSLTANYSPWQHTLKFNLNGGTIDTTLSDITVTTINPVTIPEEVPSKDNYVFYYWSTNSDGSGNKFYPGNTYSQSYNGGTITLYAIFASKDIKIYSNNNLAGIEFIEGSSSTKLDAEGNIYTTGEFIEGKSLSISSTSIKCAEIIEGKL